MVAAAMTEFELEGLCAVSKSRKLMSQTNAENGISAADFFEQLRRFGHVGRVPGTVGEKHAVGRQSRNFLRSSVERHHRHVAAARVETSDYIELYAAIHCDNVEFGMRRARKPLFPRGHAADCVARQRAFKTFKRLLRGNVRRSYDSFLTALVSQFSGKTPRVHAGNAYNTVLAHNFVQSFGISEIARPAVVVAHDKPAD